MNSQQTPHVTQQQQQQGRDTWLLCLAMLALLLLLYIPFLDSLPLLHEEPRRAVIAKTMMQSGDYLVPMLVEEIYTSKPPLFNWLIVAFSQFAGEVTEFTARLPSVVFLFFTAVLMVVGMKNYLGLQSRVFLGFSILLAPELMAKANIAEIEIVFTFFVTLSLWSWFWLFNKGNRGFGLWLFPLIIVGLSFLTKREPSIVFFYLGIVPYIVVKRQFRELFSAGHIVSVAVMLGMIGSWLAVMADSVGVDALLHSLQSQVISRGITPYVSDYIKHILTYPLHLLLTLFPFSLLLLLLFRKDIRAHMLETYNGVFVFAVLAVLVNLPLYWLRGDAAARYFLPMFPTILVVCTLVFDAMASRSAPLNNSKWAMYCVRGCAVLLVVLSVMVLGASFMPFVESTPPTVVPWYLVLIVAAPMAVASFMLAKQSFMDAAKAILPVFLGVMICVKMLFISAYLPYKIKRIDVDRNGKVALLQVRKTVDKGQSVQVVGPVHFSLYFYASQGELIVPKHYTEQYRGYVLGYDVSPEMKALSGSPGWEILSVIPYREKKLLLGIKH